MKNAVWLHTLALTLSWMSVTSTALTMSMNNVTVSYFSYQGLLQTQRNTSLTTAKLKMASTCPSLLASDRRSVTPLSVVMSAREITTFAP